MRKPYLYCIPLTMASVGTTYLALLPNGIYRTMYKDKMGSWHYTDIPTTQIPTNIWLPTSLIPMEDNDSED